MSNIKKCLKIDDYDPMLMLQCFSGTVQQTSNRIMSLHNI